MRLNEVFIFPFDDVKKGANVIIYGFGSVGRSFINQFTTLNYGTLVAVADRGADKFEHVRYLVILPEEIQKYSYDYIIVAVSQKSLALKIKSDLIELYNVDESKIVIGAERKVPVNLSDSCLEKIMQSDDFLKRELRVFSYIKDGNIDYFSNIMGEMMQAIFDENEEKVAEIRRFFLDAIEKEKSIRNRVVLLRILYKSKYFDKELFKKFAEQVDAIDDFDCKLWLLYDMSVMERNGNDYVYKEYYLDKRRMMTDSLSALYHTDIAVGKRSKERIAITTFALGGKNASHNALIVPYANEMARQGREVAVFVVDLFRYRCGECFVQPIEALEQDSIMAEEYHREIFSDNVRIVYNDGETMYDRALDVYKNLCDFAPSVVIDFCGEYSFLSPLIHKSFPIISIPMRGYTSSGCFDIYMSRNNQMCIEKNKYFCAVEESQMVEALVCTLPKEDIENYTREQCHFAEDDFIITTVGNRLRTELTIEFIDVVCAFLVNHKRARWVLVGDSECQYIRAKYHNLIDNGKIVEWGYEKSLESFYAVCDIYWNPDRTGAGGSIGSAMRCGLPIVTTDFLSDVLPRLGVENAIAGDYNDCANYVERLYSDKSFYNEKSGLMIERMGISSISQYVQKVLAVGDDLYDKRYEGRERSE